MTFFSLICFCEKLVGKMKRSQFWEEVRRERGHFIRCQRQVMDGKGGRWTSGMTMKENQPKNHKWEFIWHNTGSQTLCSHRILLNEYEWECSSSKRFCKSIILVVENMLLMINNFTISLDKLFFQVLLHELFYFTRKPQMGEVFTTQCLVLPKRVICLQFSISAKQCNICFYLDPDQSVF